MTREEIEYEVQRTGHYFSSAGMIRDVDAVALCERVAALVEENVLAWLRSHGFEKAAYHYEHRAEVDADPSAHRTCAVDVCPEFEADK